MKNKRKKQNILRLIIQCISFAFHNGYLSGWAKGRIYSGSNKAFCMPGLNCYSCPGAVGACPIGSLQAVLDDSGFHLSLYVIGFIGAVGMFCGRFVCGWICPFGLVQDLVYRIPFFKKIKNLPGHRYLRWLRFVILAVFVIALPMGIRNQAGVGQPWFCEYICPSGTLLGGIPLVVANESLQASIGPRFIWKVILLVIILIAALLSDRPFCKYICPLGVLYGLANPVSIYRLKVNESTCVKCGACQKACGGDIRVYEDPNSIDCIRCGKCMAACPTGSIYSTFSRMNSEKKAVKKAAEASIGPSAEDLRSSAVSKPGIGKRIALIVPGILCIAVSVFVILNLMIGFFVATAQYSISNVLLYVTYTLDLLIYLVAAVMTAILGGKLLRTGIRAAAADQDRPEKLRRWAMRNVILSAAGAVFAFIAYMIITLLLYGRTDTILLTNPVMLMNTSFIRIIELTAVNFITWLVLFVTKK